MTDLIDLIVTKKAVDGNKKGKGKVKMATSVIAVYLV